MAAGQGAVRAARSGPRRSPDHPLIGTGGSPRNFRRPLRSNSTAGNIRKTGGTTSMRTPVIGSLLIVALATGQPAAAAPVSVTREDQREVMVTIYNGNLGLVKDLRDVRFPSGQTEVQFMDVAALIDPTTVHLKSITHARGLKILEQNYEYDLLTSQKLMEKYVGRKVGSIRTTARITTPPCSRPTDRSSRSTARSTWATTAASSCPRSRRISWPNRPSCGSSRTRRRGPSASRRRISRAGSPGRPTTSWCSTPPTRSPTSRAGSRSTTRAAPPTATP